MPGIGSLQFSVVREATGLNATYHDFGSDNTDIETAFSIWSKGVVTVTDVPAFLDGSTPVYPDEAEFQVELYTPPSLRAMQNMVDEPAVRNQEADHVVRGAIPCFVTVEGTVFRRQSASVDMDAMTTDVADLINAKDFDETLSVSQITKILHSYDIERVSLKENSADGLKLTGSIYAPDGSIINLSGDTLNVETVKDASLLITADTVVFTVDRRSIFLEEVVLGS
jgi:hypothetical protein